MKAGMWAGRQVDNRVAIYPVWQCGYAPQSRDRVAGSANTFLAYMHVGTFSLILGPA